MNEAPSMMTLCLTGALCGSMSDGMDHFVQVYGKAIKTHGVDFAVEYAFHGKSESIVS